MSGKGLSVNTLATSSQFVNVNGDGYQHRIAWAGNGTGVLVFDADGDGKISNSKEFEFTQWDPAATGDLDAIKNVFDTNSNGKLDAGDAQWSKFNVMVNGQLVSLASLGITSIDLTPKGSGQTFSDGSAITGTATYTKSDGSAGTVGDAVLASDSNGYIVKSNVVTNSDHSTTNTIQASNADGSLAFQELVSTSADGNSVTTKFDDDGNGTYDRSQTDVTTFASGVRTRVVSDFNADGSLVDRTTTITSADLRTVTTTVDQDGDGTVDQSQTFVTNADGSSTTTTQEFSTSGVLVQQKLVQSSADGLTKTTKTDANGDGTYEAVTSEVTVVATDGSRTKTVQGSSANGTLLSKETTITTADGRTRTVTSDLDGNGTLDQQELTQRTIAANGDITTVVTTSNGDNTLRAKVTTVAAANGLSTTVSTDLTGDSVADRIHSDVTTVAADGTRTQTVQDTSASGVLLSKSVTVTSADGKSKNISVDANGDGAADTTTVITSASDGTITETDSTLNPNGTLITRVLTTTSADGLSKTMSTDANGDGAYDAVTTDVITAGTGGARIETVTTKSANATVSAKTVTTTSADSLTQTTQTDVNGDGTFDQTINDVIVLNAGVRTETATAKSSNGTLLNQTVTTVSADRKTTLVTKDSDGDGHVDSTSTQVIATDGTQTTTTTTTSADGALHGKSIVTVSADSLTTTTIKDANGDGTIDLTTIDQTVINTDGSRTETVTDKSNTGVLLDKLTTTTSGNGLTITVQKDANGDGVIDAKSVTATALNSDGSKATTTSDYAGTSSIDQTKVTTSANGLVTKTDYNYDGNATVDRTETVTKTLNADGSTSLVDAISTASGTLLSKTTNTATSDGKTVASQVDLDGDGKIDVKTTAVIDATGQTTKTVETYKVGTTTLSSRAITTTSANGLSVTTKSDLDGDGAFEQVLSDVTTLNADGSRTEAFTRSTNTAPVELTSVTTSANGLSKTTVVSDNVIAASTRDEVYRLYYAILARAPDAGGFSGNVAALNTGTTAVQLAAGLVGSAEFTQKYGTLDNTQFVTLLYQNALGRAPDAGGLNGWVATLNAGTSRASVAQQIADSAEGQGHMAGAIQTWALNNPSIVLSAVRTTTDVTTLNADGSTTEVVTNTGLVANKTTTTTSADGKTVTVNYDIDGNGVVDQKSVTTKNADGSIMQTLFDLTSAGATAHTKTITTSADGLTQTVSYDTDGNGVADKSVTDVTTLNTNGSKSTTEKTYAVNSSGTLALSAVTQTDTSADGLTVNTKWDQTGSGTFSKSRSDVTILNADGSRTETISYFTGATLTSRYLTTTSANGLSVTKQSDLTGSGTYSQTSTDVTAINADGTKTRTVSSTKADGSLISKFVTTTNANGEIVSTNEQRTGLATQTVSDTMEMLADGATRETVATTDASGKLLDKTITLTSADKHTLTIDRDANGDGVVDQHQQSVTADTGVLTSSVTDYEGAGVKADGSVSTTTANGLQTTINWDLDGNGTNDRQRVAIDTNNADGSKTTVISDTDLTTGKLATKTTIQQSSDGMVRTTSKDVDGDGAVDQVETLTADTTGATVSIMTNNAIAQKATYLLAGKVYWKQAIAAKVETDGSADGHTKTVKYDYDGNGTYEVVMQSQVQVDGSTLAMVSETNASGAVVAKGTITTTADGMITVLSKDSNNDGVIDHTETSVTHNDGSITLTKVDLNPSGVVTQTVVDTVSAMGGLTLRVTSDGQGRKTSQVSIAADGTSVTTNYDAASGQTLVVANANKAGVVTSLVTYDPLNAQPWSRIEQSFNAAGQLTTQEQYNDDGSRDEAVFDPTNAQPWSQVTHHFDAAGRLTHEADYMDAGNSGVYDWDVANTQGWWRYAQMFNAAGQRTSAEQDNDDGTKSIISFYTPTAAQQHIDYYNAAGQRTNTIDFDVTNSQGWSRVDNTLDAPSGQVVNQTIYWDNGTRAVNYWDVANTQGWSTINQAFNTAGQMTNQNVNNDDGSKVLYAYDVANSQGWSYIADVYVPNGQLITDNVYSDTPGSITVTNYDVYGNQPWTRLVQNVINNVERTATSYNDDGSYTNYQYNASHVLTGWQRYAYVSGGGGGGSTGWKMVDQWPQPSSGGNRPVLLDLNGDGHIDLRPLDTDALATGSSVTFDWNADGARDGTAWVGPQDGFLAIDLGEDGQAGPDGVIDQAKELSFSAWATDDQVAANGGSVSDLDGLRLVFDSNHDNVLDANDDRWSEFRVWRDANQNGVADDGELLSMSDAGIKLINLLPTTDGSQSFYDGSAITGTSSYQTADGTSRYLVGDATLAYQAAIPQQNAA
ncbi:beta strand repeat-containing protein [Rhizobium sp. BR 362]|uniref:beta strand repeat-containing protein n=1 Tax=Rhizobium sp. BR 362 TaxID=3040670 RepID=UPI003FA74B94